MTFVRVFTMLNRADTRMLPSSDPLMLGSEMRELIVQQKTLAARLICFMPASELSQHDSMQNMVSRSFLLSLWWKELTCLAVLVYLVLLVAARPALEMARHNVPRMIRSPPTSLNK